MQLNFIIIDRFMLCSFCLIFDRYNCIELNRIEQNRMESKKDLVFQVYAVALTRLIKYANLIWKVIPSFSSVSSIQNSIPNMGNVVVFFFLLQSIITCRYQNKQAMSVLAMENRTLMANKYILSQTNEFPLMVFFFLLAFLFSMGIQLRSIFPSLSVYLVFPINLIGKNISQVCWNIFLKNFPRKTFLSNDEE